MIVDLDHGQATDLALVGAKAAWLARGEAAGLAVLPGFVVAAPVSQGAMSLGVGVMAARGSGGARLAMMDAPLPDGLEAMLVTAARQLGERLVVRSSTALEAGGEWSGAFTSYLDIAPTEVPIAVRGCWASTFTVDALQRYEASGLEPGSVPMAVLVQPYLDASFGGVARMSGDDVVVIGVAGSPAPLVQGWEPGAHARVTSSDVVRGEEAVGLMGAELIVRVAAAMREASSRTGATGCEWGASGSDVVLLQLTRTRESTPGQIEIPAALAEPAAAAIARLVRRFPGPMGESLVLPWALASPEEYLEPVPAAAVDPPEALAEAVDLARRLSARVWGVPASRSHLPASDLIQAIRSDDPARALEAIEGLVRPEPEMARRVLSLIAAVRVGLHAAGAVASPDLAWHVTPDEARSILASPSGTTTRIGRIGFDRWEPFDIGVIAGQGRSAVGQAAAPGIAAGRMCFVGSPDELTGFRPRDVVVGTHPLPYLAPLLWDAAAVVTIGGGPAAHLFESARALGIPAVAGVHLVELAGPDLRVVSGRLSMAVDGGTGTVWAMPW